MIPRGVKGKCLRTSLSRISTDTFSVFLVSMRMETGSATPIA